MAASLAKSFTNAELLKSIFTRARSWAIGPALERVVASEADIQAFFHSQQPAVDLSKEPLTAGQLKYVRDLVDLSLEQMYEIGKKDNFKTFDGIRDSLVSAMPEWGPIYSDAQRLRNPVPPEVEEVDQEARNVYSGIAGITQWQPEFPNEETGVNWDTYKQLCDGNPILLDIMEDLKELELRITADDVDVPFESGIDMEDLLEKENERLRPYMKQTYALYDQISDQIVEIQELSNRLPSLRMDEILEACPDIESELVKDIEDRKWMIDDEVVDAYYNDELQKEELRGRDLAFAEISEEFGKKNEEAYINFLHGKPYTLPSLDLMALLNTTGTNPIVRPAIVEDDHHH